MLDAAAVSGALAGRAPELCKALFPAGVREGAEWRIGGLGGEKGRSLAVHLFGAKAGVWSDFSAGHSGDALDLVRLVRCGGDMKAALDWSRAWLGLPAETRGAAAHAPAPPPPAAESEEPRDADAQARQALALKLFLAAEPRLAGTPADAYLRFRGINLAGLNRQPRALRFHRGLWNRESQRTWPALVSAVTNDSGDLTALHRTWLERDAVGWWRKARLKVPKASLGPVAGGTVRLWRGASGKSLAAAPEGETVIIAEGIETALSVAIACPERRVLAAISIGNMGRVNLPAAIGTVIIAADNDPQGSPADAALQAAASRFAAMGKTVRIARSPTGKDFNDCLNG